MPGEARNQGWNGMEYVLKRKIWSAILKKMEGDKGMELFIKHLMYTCQV